MSEGKQGDRRRYEETDNQRQQTGHVDQEQQQGKHEQGPLVSLRDVMALLQGLDRPKPAVDHEEARKKEHQRDDHTEHDEQRNTDPETGLNAESSDESNTEQGEGHEYECKEQRQAEIFPERMRMPERGKLHRLGIVVGGEPKGRDAHADKRAERQREQSPEKCVIRLGAAEWRIDCAAEAFGHALGDGNEHKRPDKKPRALLERLPAEAERGAWRESYRWQDSTEVNRQPQHP